MGEAGLLSIWQQGASAEATYCVRKIQQEMNDQIRKGEKKRLSINDLSGAFAVLSFGYLLAIVTFSVENGFDRILFKHRPITLGIKNCFKKPAAPVNKILLKSKTLDPVV
jgi:hypothetical protein